MTSTKVEPDGPAPPGIEIPARWISPPAHLSSDARMLLGMPAAPRPAFPAENKPDDWQPYIDHMNDRFRENLGKRLRSRLQRVTQSRIGGIPTYSTQPDETDHAGKVCMSIHGGALMLLGGDLVAYDALKSAAQTNCMTFALDYRMPPHHPFPAGLDDCVNVYTNLLGSWRAQDIVVTGVSAGGNLAAALMLKLRDAGLPMPAALILRTPEIDLTESGDTFQTNLGLDNVLPVKLMQINRVYAGTMPLDDPYVSPLFADLNGFPPTLVQSGTRDLFLSNAVRFHRRLRDAAVKAELHIWEAMPHAGFGGFSAEDEQVAVEIRRFIAAVLT